MQFFLNISFKYFLFILSLCLLLTLSLFVSNTYAFEEERCNLIQTKACVDFGKRMINGIETKDECWKYEEKFQCIGKEKNECRDLEANLGCNEITAKCQEQSDFGLCKNLEKKFSCSKKLEPKPEIKYSDTKFTTIRDEKDLSKCSKEEIDDFCEVVDEICVEPKQTRNINGKMVEKDCWKWEKKYACHSSTIVNECNNIDEGCKLTGENKCLHRIKIKSDPSSEGKCVHWEKKYICANEQKVTNQCIATEFCNGDICTTPKRNQFDDFGESISKLGILASMKKDDLDGCKCPDGKEKCEPNEINPGDCKLFSGAGKQCHKSTAQHNCCSEKGFIRGLIKCNEEEKDLYELRKGRLCYPVGSWEGKSTKDKLTFTSYQSFCCFKSKMSKIIQVGGRKQLGIGWGDIKSPDCRPLTLEEVRRVDFNLLDFSELFSDMQNTAQSKISENQLKMQETMNNAKEGMAANSELLNKKIKNFYGGVK